MSVRICQNVWRYIPQDHNLNIVCFIWLLCCDHTHTGEYCLPSVMAARSEDGCGLESQWETFLTFWENCFKLVYSAAVEVSLAAVTYGYELFWKFLLFAFPLAKPKHLCKDIQMNLQWLVCERACLKVGVLWTDSRIWVFRFVRWSLFILWSLFGFICHVVDVFANVSANLLPPSSGWQPGSHGL
jgi:hypothetical protein